MKRHYIAAAFASVFFASVPSAFADNSVQSKAPKQLIQELINKTYAKPQHSVETEPVVVVGDYALADWVQGAMGGRALLHKGQGGWEIMACGGDGFTDPATLQAAGIPLDSAKTLTAQLKQAEKTLPASRVKMFGLFNMAGAKPTH